MFAMLIRHIFNTLVENIIEYAYVLIDAINSMIVMRNLRVSFQCIIIMSFATFHSFI